MQIDIGILTGNQPEALNELLSVFEEVFEMKGLSRPGPAELRNLLEKDNFIAVAASADEKVVGGLTLYVLDPYYSTKPLAYIYDLAVSARYQRKGIGRRLIEFTGNYCKEQGFEEMYVQAARADRHALEFYRATRPTTEEQVIQFSYSLLK